MWILKNTLGIYCYKEKKMYFCKLKLFIEIGMRTNNDFVINFSGLSNGEHVFDYKIDSSLFKEFENEDIVGADIDAIITLLKEENMLSFRFNFKGSMVVLCDLCLDELEIDIDSENNLYVKFSDHYTEEGDDIIEIPVLEHKIDLKEYVYQYIILAKPMKCSHQEGECDEDMLERLAQLNTEIIAEEVDPRWEALKNIKID